MANEQQAQLTIDGFAFYREAIGEWHETERSSIKNIGLEDLEEALTYCDDQVSRLQDDLPPIDPPKHINRLFKAIEEQRRLAAVAEYQN
jgi:hypothetical protein